jgi:Outer membrane protein beta-barrel domain
MRLSALLAALAAVALSPPARAADRTPVLEVSPLVGGLIQAGDNREVLEDAALVGVQVARDLQPYLSIVGTFSWANTHAKELEDAELDLFQYDLGLRGQQTFALGSGMSLRPFLGTGMGFRTYDFHDDQYTGETSFVWYVSGGAELGWKKLVTGITARHQLTSPGDSSLDRDTGQDVELFTSVGLRF